MRQMKDSGIEWIGKIPENWNKLKIKYISSISSGEYISKEEYENNGLYPIIGANGEIGRTNKSNNQELVVTTGRVGTIGTAHKIKEAWITDNVLIIGQIKVNVDFFRYSILNLDFQQMTSGTAIPLITATKIINQFIPNPSIEEQHLISAYLDRQCTLIDSVIEKTKASIEEYKKLRQAVITQAVTKGVRGDRAMKDSGIEWIGEIPEEWETSKIRYIGTLQNGISKGGDFFGEGFPFVSYGDVYKNFELPKYVAGLVRTSDKERQIYSVEKGDIFFTRTSETIEEVGFSAVCTRTIDNATFAGFVIRLRPYKVDGIICTVFAKYYFRGEQIRKYLVKEMNLVTRASLGQGLLNAMSVLIPPIAEQQEIAAYLDQKCVEIDSLITKKEQFLTELDSYKKSIIYEYVTGKKEVPQA